MKNFALALAGFGALVGVSAANAAHPAHHAASHSAPASLGHVSKIDFSYSEYAIPDGNSDFASVDKTGTDDTSLIAEAEKLTLARQFDSTLAPTTDGDYKITEIESRPYVAGIVPAADNKVLPDNEAVDVGKKISITPIAHGGHVSLKTEFKQSVLIGPKDGFVEDVESGITVQTPRFKNTVLSFTSSGHESVRLFRNDKHLFIIKETTH